MLGKTIGVRQIKAEWLDAHTLINTAEIICQIHFRNVTELMVVHITVPSEDATFKPTQARFAAHRRPPIIIGINTLQRSEFVVHWGATDSAAL